MKGVDQQRQLLMLKFVTCQVVLQAQHNSILWNFCLLVLVLVLVL